MVFLSYYIVSLYNRPRIMFSELVVILSRKGFSTKPVYVLAEPQHATVFINSPLGPVNNKPLVNTRLVY